MIKIMSDETIKFSPYTAVIKVINPDPHIHEFWEIVYPIYNEETTHFVNDFKCTFTNKEFLIVKPKDKHVIFANNYTTQLLHRDIYVQDSEMKRICDAISPSLYTQLLARTTPILTHFPERTLEILETRLNLFSNYHNQKNAFLTAIHSSIVAYLLGIYIESQVNLPTGYPIWIDKLIEKMQDPEFLNKNITDIVKTTNYSHGHVCRLFKQYTKKTLVQYMLEQRLHNSLMLLQDKKRRIIDIALDMGFCSQSSYINAFKKLFKLSPSAWRKQNLAGKDVKPLEKWGHSDTI
ncbi:MAG: helix-turn-helix domain-containing protein [Clostridiales bacterium]|nr:helix-turn-helix domain-containing protein [Clostridiales bacterium]